MEKLSKLPPNNYSDTVRRRALSNEYVFVHIPFPTVLQESQNLSSGNWRDRCRFHDHTWPHEKVFTWKWYNWWQLQQYWKFLVCIQNVHIVLLNLHIFIILEGQRQILAMKSRHKSQAPIPRNTLNQGVQLFSQDQQTSQQNLFAKFLLKIWPIIERWKRVARYDIWRESRLRAVNAK